MRVLVDTSVWSLALRRQSSAVNSPPAGGPAAVALLRNLITDYRVVMIGPVRQEILSGIRNETQFERLRRHLSAFPDIALVENDYILAARFFNTCRAAGIQGSGTDFLICSAAANRNLAILTTDQDFEALTAHLPIQLVR